MSRSQLYPLTPAGVAADIDAAIREQNRGGLPRVSGSYIVPGWRINSIVDGFSILDDAPLMHAKVIEFKQMAHIEKASIALSAGGAGVSARMRLALYLLDSGTGAPSGLHADYGLFDLGSSGTKHLSIEGTIPAGLYWEVRFFNTFCIGADGWNYYRTNRASSVGEVQAIVQAPIQEYMGSNLPIGSPGAQSKFDTAVSESSLYIEDTDVIEGWVTNGAPESLAEYSFYPSMLSNGLGPLVFYKLTSDV